MIVYLDNIKKIELVFNYNKDINASKRYFSEIIHNDYLKKNYFKNFSIVDCLNVKSIHLKLPRIKENFGLVEKDKNSFGLTDDDLDKLNNDKILSGLSIWQLYGITDLEVEIMYNDNSGEIKQTKIFLMPSFVKEDELKRIIESLREKKFLNLSFEPSLKSFFSESFLKGNTEPHYLLLRKIYKTFNNIQQKIKLNTTIKRNIVEINCGSASKMKGRLYAPQKFILGKNKNIVRIVDRRPFISYDLAENSLIKNFFERFMINSKVIYENVKDNINEQEKIITELKSKEIEHRAYKYPLEKNKIEKLKMIGNNCINMIEHMKKNNLYKSISRENIYKTNFSFIYANAYNYNPNYKKIHELLKLLNSLLSFNYFSLSDIERDIEQLNNLYEEWTFYLLESVLSSDKFQLIKTKDILQEKFTKKLSRSVTSRSVLEYETIDNKYLIKIFNEKVYEDLSKKYNKNKLMVPDYGFVNFSNNKEKCEVFNCISHKKIKDEKKYFNKKCPDISIEIFDKKNLDIPIKIITFDCTFTPNSKYLFYKYAYADTIRLVKDKFENAERIVTSANSIYWGEGKNQNFSTVGYNCYDISLNPSSEDNLEKFFVFLAANKILPEII